MSDTLQQQLEHSLNVLDVSDTDGWSDIEKHYRQLIHRWHPDRHSDDDEKVAEERFIEINTAFKLVREHYKKHGRIPRPITKGQTGPLLGDRKELSPTKPRKINKKLILSAMLAALLLIVSFVVLWALDSRLAENNRDRATVEKSTNIDEKAQQERNQAANELFERTQSQNSIEP